GLLLPGVELDYVRDGVPGTHQVVYGDTFAGVAALIGGDVTPATLGAANKDEPIFRPGALLELATGELQVVAGAPPGSTGFYLERPEASDPAGIESLFQLLAYSMMAGGGFLQSPEGLPVSPVESADSGTDGFTAKAIRDPAQPVWIYDKLLPAYRYAADGWGATAPAGLDLVLPSPWDDPYRGIAPGAQATLELSFRDVYGNVAAGTPSQLAIPVGYFDALDGLDRWPSVAAAYTFAAGTPPACLLAFTFDPSTYVAGSGLSVAAAVRNAAVRACRYAEIYRQVRRRDVSVTLTSSLDQPASPAPPTPYALDKQAFVALAGSAYAFLTAASGLVAYEHPVVDGETFAQIAGQYEVSVVDVAKANDALDASLLFAGKSLSVPTYYTFHHGDTLAITKLTTEQITEGSLDVPLNEGTDVSRASQLLTYTLQDGDTLRHIAFETSAAAASVAAANPTAPLTSGLTMTAGSATAETGAGLASGQHDTLDTMVARFAALKVPTTPADLGVANQDTANLFDASAQAEVSIADYVLQAGDTLRSLAARVRDPLATGPLLGDNQNVPDLFPAGAALWESNQSYALEAGDTLAAVAARFAIDLPALMGLSANQTAPLVHGESLVVPAQVTFGAGGPPGSACMMSATDTLTKVAGRYGADSGDLVALNRYTQDLFVPGSITVAGVQLTVTVADTFDSLFAQATGAGYSGAFSDFAPAIAAAIDGGAAILAQGALLACPPMVVGPGTSPAVAQTLADVAAGYGVSPHSLVSANGSLRSLLRAGVTISLAGPDGPVPVTVGADDTLLTLVARFTAKGVPLTLEDFATNSALSGGDFLALGTHLVPPPVDVTATVPFAETPQNPEVIFPVVVSVTLARAPALVDPDFADVADVASATTRIPPKAEGTSDDPALTLQAFAASFEEGFPGLKVAVSQKQGSGASAQGQVWAADFRAGRIEFSVPANGTGPNASAAYFALPPISTTLLTYDEVSIQPYVSGSGLQPSAPHRFAAVDVDVWAGQFFTAVDTFLSPTFAAGVRTVDAASLDAVVAHKLTIAQRLSDKVLPVFTDGAQDDIGAAQEELLQQLLVLLGNADTIDTIAQLPVDVSASPYSSASTAPRLSGSPSVPGAAQSGQAGYALSPAKVPLAKTTSPKETSSLTFAVSVKQPAADRTLELDDVAYTIGELEIGIHDVSGIADYQQSSWLTLLRPLSVPLGELLIPIPLRVAPTPPTMVGQTATARLPAGSPTLSELKLWDYAFCFDQPATDQDTRYVSVTFNAPPPATNEPKESEVRKLFDELAQFVSVYPQVQQDLTLLPVLPPGSPNPTVAKAVSVFADLVGRVADAWAGVADDASAGDGEAGITVEYEVDAPTGSGEMTLTTSAASSLPWPDIWAVDPAGKHHRLTGEKPVTGATSRKYTFPSGVPDTTAKYEWRFPALDVTALQSGV
ncbi:MAG: LysM peptidoglycan-binding domain-containing protein, partial [Actinomycetota bacterium]|nr:LysM peptidoglycan-binding domain-containing protein [Actinomycetota bacterium]